MSARAARHLIRHLLRKCHLPLKGKAVKDGRPAAPPSPRLLLEEKLSAARLTDEVSCLSARAARHLIRHLLRKCHLPLKGKAIKGGPGGCPSAPKTLPADKWEKFNFCTCIACQKVIQCPYKWKIAHLFSCYIIFSWCCCCRCLLRCKDFGAQKNVRGGSGHWSALLVPSPWGPPFPRPPGFSLRRSCQP